MRRALILIGTVGLGLAGLPASGLANAADGCQPSVRSLEPAPEFSDPVWVQDINASGLAAGQWVGGGPLIMWDSAGEHTVHDNSFADQNVSAMD